LPAFFPVISLNPAVSPPTIWASATKIPKLKNQKKELDDIIKNLYQLPLFVHFPDYGILSLSSKKNKEVYCCEKWIIDKKMKGLNLGFANIYYHTKLLPFHYGEILLNFKVQNSESLDLIIKVEDEIYPKSLQKSIKANQWNGLKRCWMNAFTLDKKTLTMGDNILLGGIAHLAIHLKSEMLKYTPPFDFPFRKNFKNHSKRNFFYAKSIHDFLKRTLDLSFSSIGKNGEINWVYQENKDNDGKNRFMDCTPSNLIAFAHYITFSNDFNFLKRHINNVIQAIKFLLSLDKDNDTILEMPFHGNCFSEERTRNWWDNFAFGYKDAYINLLSFSAFKLIFPLLQKSNLKELQINLKNFIERFPTAFKKTFYNPKTGVFAGWISEDGKFHDYLFTFITAMAINEDIVPKTDAIKMMKFFLDKMKGLNYDGRYGIPGNLMPVAASDTISWDAMGKWGVYENGGLCGMTAGHFLKALYKCGMKKEADRIFFTMLETFENEPTHSGVFPGYTKSIDWRTKDGIPCGYNYLADNYYFLSVVTSYFSF